MSQLQLLQPQGLWLLMLLPLLWWASSASRSELGRARRIASTCLRSLSVIALAFALAQPIQSVPSRKSSTVFVVDVSDSVDDAALREVEHYIEGAYRASLDSPTTRVGEPRTHHMELVTFAGEARRAQLPQRQKPWSIARHLDGRATDIERALSLALGLLQADAAQTLLLFSDGRETRGSLARMTALLARRGIVLSTARPHAGERAEVGLLDLTVPSAIRVGEPFELHARVVASVPMRVTTRLLRDGAPDPQVESRVESLPAGETTLSFRSLIRAHKSVLYRLELTPEGPDQFADNNHFEQKAVVRGAPRVLLVEREPAQAYALLDLLRAAGFEVALRTPEHAPRSATELAEVDFYIVSDVPAVSLSPASSKAIAQYVMNGGGFMMAGGERAFGLGGYRGTALESLLPVSLASVARRDEPSLALVLVIDKSGSMAGEKLERAKEAALATAALLPTDSLLGVIGFDAQPERVLRLALTAKLSATERKLGMLAAGGGTALFPALDAAYADLAGVRARVKHVVLLTDGQTPEQSLPALARSMRADGITLSTIGLGEEVNRGLLTELAQLAGGRAYFTRDPSKVPRLFTDETTLVSRSLAVEERVRVRRGAPAECLRGIPVESAPPLSGYVATTARPAPAQLLLASQRDEPLLARMRIGSGWSLAWTADLKPRWSAPWFGWRPFSALLAQLIREHMRRDETADLAIETALVGDTVHAAIDVLDDRGRFVDGLTGQLTLSDPRGVSETSALFQSAPGRYEWTRELPGLGAYTLRAVLSAPDPASPQRLASGSVSHPFPTEYQPPFAASPAVLEAAARRTGGLVLGLAQPRLPADGRTISRPVPRWPALVWLALLSYLLDVAIRRTWRRELSRRQGA